MRKSRLIAVIFLSISIAAMLGLTLLNLWQTRRFMFQSHDEWVQRVSRVIQAERLSECQWILTLRGLPPRRIKAEVLNRSDCAGAYWFDVDSHEFERWLRASQTFLKTPDPRLVLAQLKAAKTNALQMGPVMIHDRTLYNSVAVPFGRQHVLVVVLEGSEIRRILQREEDWSHVQAFVYDGDHNAIFQGGDLSAITPILTDTLARAGSGEQAGTVSLQRRMAWQWFTTFHSLSDFDWTIILAEPARWAYAPFLLFTVCLISVVWLAGLPWRAADLLRRAHEAHELKQFANRVDNFVHGKEVMLHEPPYPFHELTPIVQALRWLMPQWKKAENFPKELGLERKLLSLLIESLPEGILFFNSQGALQLGNELGKVFLALQQEAGHEFKMVSGVQVPRGFLEPFAEPVFTGQQKNLGKEIEVGWADGKHLYRIWAECVDVDEQIGGFIIVVRDITFRKQWEYVQEQVLSGITHDLRGPLSAIMGYLDLLRRQLKEAPPKIVEYLSLAREAGVRLTQMVSDILDVVRFEQGKMDLDVKAISIDEMFSRLQNIFGVTAGQKNITLQLHAAQSGLMVAGDPKLIERVLDNLVGNAIKFTPNGGNITVRAEHGKDRIVFQVADTGRGIPKEAQSRIFDKFQQVRPGDRSAGYGLGLAVAKFIVEAHKGEIRVESEVDKGSTFTFWIPDRALSMAS